MQRFKANTHWECIVGNAVYVFTEREHRAYDWTLFFRGTSAQCDRKKVAIYIHDNTHWECIVGNAVYVFTEREHRAYAWTLSAA